MDADAKARRKANARMACDTVASLRTHKADTQARSAHEIHFKRDFRPFQELSLAALRFASLAALSRLVQPLSRL